MQKYRFLCNVLGHISFEEFLFGNHKLQSENDFLPTFDFSQVVAKVKAELSNDVEFLFFEDLKYDREYFVKQLSRIIRIEDSLVSDYLERPALRVRPAEEGYVLRATDELSMLGRFAAAFDNEFYWKLQRRQYQRSSQWRHKEKKIFYRKKIRKIEKPSGKVIEKIKLYYRDSNNKMVNHYGFNRDKFDKYLYF